MSRFVRQHGVTRAGMVMAAMVGLVIAAPWLGSSQAAARGWLGVSIRPLTPEVAEGFGLPAPSGALVAGVQEGSPAARAGVRPGDVITEYEGRKVSRPDELPRMVAETPAGRPVPITIVRGGKSVYLIATIAALGGGQHHGLGGLS